MDRGVDRLTGLVSGTELQSEMEALIEKGEEFSFVSIDMDGLLVINRDYGHEAGDAILRLIAKCLNEVFPEPCTVFRHGGDEFNVLMPGYGKETAFLKTEQARKLICEERLGYVSSDGAALTQSASAGISSFPDDGSRAADVMRRADSAMVRAKKNGRNRVCLARDEKLLPKTSHYTQAQLERLTKVSQKEGVGEAALLREALDDLLRKYEE